MRYNKLSGGTYIALADALCDDRIGVVVTSYVPFVDKLSLVRVRWLGDTKEYLYMSSELRETTPEESAMLALAEA